MSRHSGHIYRDITGFFILIPVGILFVNSKKKTVSKQRLGEVGKGGLSEGVVRGNMTKLFSSPLPWAALPATASNEPLGWGNPMANLSVVGERLPEQLLR